MARNVHWRIQFRTRSEKIGVLNLYEENYSGAVVELTPAAVPFETQEDSSDKWLEPIRKQSGYIRVLDEGNTEGIMPVGMKDRYVEYREDDVLQWCGYMVPDVYSSDWDVTPLEVEFPVVGGLGVLEGIYLNEDDGLGVVPLARLVYDALKATGVDYSMIYFPKEVLQYAGAGDYLFPISLEVSRFNFFQDNDSLNNEDYDWTRYNGETHYNVLAEVMKFFGWTIRERGKDLWVTSTANNGSFSVSVDDLRAVSYGGAEIVDENVGINQYDLSSLELAGADHKRDILQGRKKVVVKASVNPVGAVVPSVDKAKMRMGISRVNELNLNGSVYAYEKQKQYVPKQGYTDVVLRSYAENTPIQGPLGKWVAFENQLYDMDGWNLLPLYVGAYFVEREQVSKEEYEKKKNWNLTESILIKIEGWDFVTPDEKARANMKFLEIRSRNIANYVNGAFVISANTRCIYESAGFQKQERNGAGSLEVRFRVGDKFWNGSGWGTSDVWFLVEMGNEVNPSDYEGTGKIISTKTLDMPYDGADGYVMPITEPLNGEVELDLRMVYSKMDVLNYQVLENLKVDYFGVEDDEGKSDDSENRYAKTTGLNYTNEEEIRLSMATNNNNKAGYGIISRYGDNVESVYIIGKGTMRPEMNLVRKGVSLYGRSTEKLTLQLDKISARPHDVILWEGKKYLLASEAVNWAEETGQYIFMSYEL